jgi:hypothetical protein
MRSTLALVLFSFGIAVTGCSLKSDDPPKELKKSSSIPLAQMNGSYGAFSDGTKLELFVAYISDGFLLLRDGDSASVDVNGTAVPLTERIEDDKVHYIAELASPPAEPVVTVTFVRGGESVVGKVRIAPAFELKSPPSAAKLGDTVSVDIDPRPNLEEWKGALGPLIHHVVEVHGDCIDEEKQKKIELCAKDSPAGTCAIVYPLPFDTSKILLREGATGCEVDVQVRLETGAPPGEGKFGGGVFEGLQHRRFKLALTK